jgi:hypothetical protein
MGTTTVALLAMKIGLVGGVGMALTSAVTFFHSYKPTFKKKGGKSDAGELTSLREKARSIS